MSLASTSSEDDKLQKSKSIDGRLKHFFRKIYVKYNTGIFMFVCTMVLYEYTNSLRNDVCNLFVYINVRIKIYQFYHGNIYIANEGRHVRIIIYFQVVDQSR
jgi:hypothetical protein